MDFTTRQPMAPSTDRFASADRHHESEQPTGSNKKPEGSKKSGLKRKEAWAKGLLMVFLLCLVILVAALLLFIGSGDRSHETKYVDTSSYQVVEVASNNKQPARYFGNITAIADNYVVLDNAYAAVPSTSGTNPVSVLPLACTDVNGSSELVLNRSRIILWDNLAANSNASEAIKEFKANNPGGQCPLTQPVATSEQSGATRTTNPAPTANDSGTTSTDKTAPTAPITSPRPQTP